jgi:hypothetical protein
MLNDIYIILGVSPFQNFPLCEIWIVSSSFYLHGFSFAHFGAGDGSQGLAHAKYHQAAIPLTSNFSISL